MAEKNADQKRCFQASDRNMTVRIKCAFVLLILTLMGLGPMPVTSLIGLYVVFARPRWFKELVLKIYADDPGEQKSASWKN